jgi:hypothetical protein
VSKAVYTLELAAALALGIILAAALTKLVLKLFLPRKRAQ